MKIDEEAADSAALANVSFHTWCGLTDHPNPQDGCQSRDCAPPVVAMLESEAAFLRVALSRGIVCMLDTQRLVKVMLESLFAPSTVVYGYAFGCSCRGVFVPFTLCAPMGYIFYCITCALTKDVVKANSIIKAQGSAH